MLIFMNELLSEKKLLEAPGDEDAGDDKDKYQLGELESDPGGGPEDTGGGEDDPGNEDEPDAGGDEEPAMGEEGGDETDTAGDEPGADDTGSDDASTENPATSVNKDDKETTKKLSLFYQFKELIGIIDTLLTTVKNVRFTDVQITAECNYIIEKLEYLKDQVEFSLVHKLVKEEYKIMLKLFFYFKYQLRDYVNLTEKLFDASKQIKTNQ
jgi:hypothetical protein